jgi:hypothetical protein
MALRQLLEPMVAAEALAHITPERLRQIRSADAETDDALRDGDVNAYMESNFRFHALIYSAAPMPVANRMIESLWMQFGPFMRVVYGRFGTANLIDQHALALEAIEAGDAEALRRAISGDILDGMGLIGRNSWAVA